MNYADMILENRLIYTVSVLFVGYLLSRSFARNIYIYALFHSLGTFLHELSHYFMSVVFNGKPRAFSIFPSKDKNGGIVLGYVESLNMTWYNKLPIGLAPLLLLVLVYFFDMYWFIFVDKNIFTALGYIFIISVLVINSIPSIQDLKISFTCFTGLIFYGFFGTLIYMYFTKG